MSIPGRMVDSIEESIKTIRNMVTESTPGPMVEHTQVTGVEANSTDLERIQCQLSQSNMDSGKRARELNGSMLTRYP